MLLNFFKIAFRSLLRQKIYSFVNIGGLAMVLAVSMLILVYVVHELSYDRFHVVILKKTFNDRTIHRFRRPHRLHNNHGDTNGLSAGTAIGLDREHVIVIPIERVPASVIVSLKSDLERSSDIKNVGIASLSLYKANMSGVSLVTSPVTKEQVGTKWIVTNNDFLKTLDIEITRSPEINPRYPITYLTRPQPGNSASPVGQYQESTGCFRNADPSPDV
jgi:putative ABC transport system permease protein